MSNFKKEELNKDKISKKNSQRFAISEYHTPYQVESYRAIVKPVKNVTKKSKNSEYYSIERRSQRNRPKLSQREKIEHSRREKILKQNVMNVENAEDKKEINNNIMKEEVVNKEDDCKESIIKKVVDFFKGKKKKSSQMLDVNQTYTQLEPTEVLERSNRKIGNKKIKRKKNVEKVRKKANSTGSVGSINEPGSIKEMVPFEEYNFNGGYDKLIEQIKEENEKRNLYVVKCNSPCNPGDLIVDKAKTVTFIFKRSPLMNLLLYQDEIVRLNGESLEFDDDEYILPVEPCQRLDLVIRRRGRSMAVPFKRQTSINLDMEYGYYYFIVTVPRLNNHIIGIEFYNTYENEVIIQNVTKNTIGYHLFSRGDYICDINGIPVKTAEEIFKMITEDQTTSPTFSCVVKRSCAKPTQLKIVKTLFECPVIPIQTDIINIVKAEEQKIIGNDVKKSKTRTVLKNPNHSNELIHQKFSTKKIIAGNGNKKFEKSKYSSISLRSSKSKIRNNNVKINETPKTNEVESDIENIVFINPVPAKMSSFKNKIV